VSFHTRSFLFFLIIFLAAIAALIFIFYGAIFGWDAETLAIVLSSIFSGTSIGLLIVEKVYDRPNFLLTLQKDTRKREKPNPSIDLVFTLRNNGFRGVASLRVRASLLSSRYYELHRTPLLLMEDIPNTVGHSIGLRLDPGAEAELFLPISEFEKAQTTEDQKGFIRLNLVTAYGVYHAYFKYTIKDHQLKPSYELHLVGMDWINDLLFGFANFKNRKFFKSTIQLPIRSEHPSKSSSPIG
jgi:hypothetical protein